MKPLIGQIIDCAHAQCEGCEFDLLSTQVKCLQRCLPMKLCAIIALMLCENISTGEQVCSANQEMQGVTRSERMNALALPAK